MRYRQTKHRTSPRTRASRLAILGTALACCLPMANATSLQEDSKVTCEQAALAEEQALIARQIKRLTAVMVQLERRYRDEGRVHAAGLASMTLKVSASVMIIASPAVLNKRRYRVSNWRNWE